MTFLPDLALVGFVFFGLFSPGPNVILVTTSGARFGIMRSIPHILGIVFGVGIVAGVVGMGVGQFLTAAPNLTLALKVIACLWIIWMAYQLWNSSPSNPDSDERPFTFIEALLFQWVNPKIWAVAISASAFILDEPPLVQGLTLGATFSTINFFVCNFWTAFGAALASLLNDPMKWRLFMRCMAAGLAVFSILVFQ